MNLFDCLVVCIRDYNGQVTSNFQTNFNALESKYLIGYRTARQKLKNQTSSIVLKHTTLENKRRYLKDASLPKDPAYRCCPFCNHESVDFPDINSTVDEENKKNMVEYKKKMDVIASSKNGVATTNVKVDKISRAPPKPAYKSNYYRCWCSSFRCLSWTCDTGNTCKNKCIDLSSSKRYGFDPVTGQCLCPLHQYKCDVMFTVEAFTAVLLRALLDSADYTTHIRLYVVSMEIIVCPWYLNVCVRSVWEYWSVLST